MYFWAKTTEDGQPGISVRGHCFNVACVARVLAENNADLLARWGLSPDMVAFLAGAHDCGKISFEFQKKCTVWYEAYTKKFQRNSFSSENGLKHGEISMLIIVRYLYNRQMTSSRSASLWGLCSGVHHGQLFKALASSAIPPAVPVWEDNEPDWEAERVKLLDELAAAFEIRSLPNVSSRDAPELWYVAGLISLADWIASDECFFPAGREASAELPELPEQECTGMQARARSAVQALQLGPLAVLPDRSFEEVFHFSPNAFQKAVMDLVRGPGLYILEAPMGMGKTEAAFWAAWQLMARHQAGGIYFALPTQVTSNRIWMRMRDFAESVFPDALEPRLIHSNAWMLRVKSEEDDPSSGFPFDPSSACPSDTSSCLPDTRIRFAHTPDADPNEDKTVAEQWFSSSKRSLFAPLGAGTADQALMGVLAVRHFFMRRYALAGKVVIFDEVHSYDAYTGLLVRRLCKELIDLGSTVIVLSATLTNRARLELLEIAGEKAVSDTVNTPVRLTAKFSNVPSSVCLPLDVAGEKEVRSGMASREVLLEHVEKLVGQNACVLWICDTVNAAQETCVEFMRRGNVPEDDIGLLHSRFPLFQRNRNEEYWLERLGKNNADRRGCILVATQVVEQSVDIDADILVSELAPTDMLLQRIGRLQRHDRGPRPWPAQCWLIAEPMTAEESFGMSARTIKTKLGPKHFVYWPDVLLRTLRVWEKRSVVSIPGDIRPMLEETYAEEELPDSWCELEEERLGDEYAKKILATLGTNNTKMTRDDFDDPYKMAIPSTRINEFRTEEVILCRGHTDNGVVLLGAKQKKDEILTEKTAVSARSLMALAQSAVRLPSYKLEGHVYPPNGSLPLKKVREAWEKDESAILKVVHGYRSYYLALVSSENAYVRYSCRLGVEFNDFKEKE